MANIDSDHLEEVVLALISDAFGDSSPPAPPPDLNDSRLGRIVGIYVALIILEPQDGAYPWSLAGVLEALGRHEESALVYLQAAQTFDSEFAAGNGLTGDEDEWAKTARWHAARLLLIAGHPEAAMALLPMLDEDDQAEIRAQL